MNSFVIASRIGLRAALQLRRLFAIPRESALNVFDLAMAIGIDVRFVDAPSLDGMYSHEPGPIIFLPSSLHRPRGRINFSCAHELGHHELNHGTTVDQYVDDEGSRKHTSEEQAANVFASQLLMPRPAIVTLLSKKGMDPNKASPIELYIMSKYFGVGYQTLLKHLHYGLGLVSKPDFDKLLKARPKELRQQIIGDIDAKEVTVVDTHWPDLPVDLEVGDKIAFERVQVSAGKLILSETETSAYKIFRAIRPGSETLDVGGRNVLFRISRANYVGSLRNRFLEEPEDE